MFDSVVLEGAARRGRWLVVLVGALAVLAALALTSSAHAGGGPDCDDAVTASFDGCECSDDTVVRTTAGVGYGYVCKTAHAEWTREWHVEKKIMDEHGNWVDEATVKLFDGDSFTANYVVGLSKKDVYTVRGEIHISLGDYSNGEDANGAYGPTITIVDYITSHGYDKRIYPDITGDHPACVNHGNNGQLPPEVPQADYDNGTNGTIVCHYEAQVPKGTPGVNTVKVWIGGDSVASSTDTADYTGTATFESFQPIEPFLNEVYLKDDNFEGSPIRGPFDGTQTRFPYPKDFECQGNHYRNVNTVEVLAQRENDKRVVQNGGPIASDSATLRVKCFDLEVTKTAKTKFDRTYKWEIHKHASHKQVVLARKKGDDKKGDLHLSRYAKEANVKYRVKVESYPEDHDFLARGKITITNNHPHRDAHILTVKDVIKLQDAADISANVRCEGDPKEDKLEFPTRLPAGETLVCHWRSQLPDGSDRRNVAKAKLQNYHYELKRTDNPGWHVVKTKSGKTWFKGHAPVRFGDPQNVYDKKVRVYDTLAPKGFLGWVSQDETPKKFHYYVNVKPGGLAPWCGKGSLYNKASLVTYDTKTKLHDSVTIPILVKCFVHKDDPPKKTDPPKKGDGGKTPPPVDDKKAPPPPADDKKDYEEPKDTDHGSCVPGKGKPWHLIGSKGKKTEFFESGKTYKQVMRKGLRGKNPHNQLMLAYINAKLLMLGGADYGRKVAATVRWAERYVLSHGPRDVIVKRALNANKAKKLRKMVNKKKRVLIRYAKHAHMPRCDVR